uniref:non-specific serine/threonine protein kinase n=1 Tax=Anthurium amnicola TaxID=1678845 RepID=A0A1D1XN93_9ARAE
MGGLKLNSLNLSSNSLSGQIPPALQNQAYDRSFLSNPGLCASSSAALNLPPCGSGSGGSGRLPKGLLILFLLLGFLLFLATVLFGYFAVRYQRRRKDADDLASWKLTSFHSHDFTESNIVRGLTAGNLVGSGGSGQVYRVPLGNRGPEEAVAVKKIWNSKKLDSNLEKEFQAEVNILGSIRHSNIVKLLCCISSQESKLLVYEYMENGSLHQWLHEKSCMGWTESGREGASFLDWPARLGVAVGAAQGLCYMHHDCSPAIVHRDVKSSNVMLDEGFQARLGDFGLARQVEHDKSPDATVTAGTMGYLAPEYLLTGRATEKTDVFSFGAVVLEVACGRRPIETAGASTSIRGVNLVEWVWGLHGEGRLLEAADARLGGEFDQGEMRKVLLVGLVCSHPDPATRPGMRSVVQMLSGEADPPFVPGTRPSMSFSTNHHLLLSLQDSVSDCNAMAILSTSSSSSSVSTTLIAPP